MQPLSFMRFPLDAPTRAAVLRLLAFSLAFASVTVSEARNQSDVQPSLEAALSSSESLEIGERLGIIYGLRTPLSGNQIEVLLGFISRPSAEGRMTIGEQAAFKNDVLNLLVRQPGLDEKLVPLLIAIHRSEAQDGAMRDYALQHLAAIVLDVGGKYDWSEHWRALEGGNKELAATAMLHLVSAADRGLVSVNNVHLIKSIALKYAVNGELPEIVRLTAIQVCGRLKHDPARDAAREIAGNERLGLPLRIAAIATLGDLSPAPATREYLRGIANSPERRLRLPARSALARLDERMSANSF